MRSPEISGVAILQKPVAILQKQGNRQYNLVYGRFSYLRLSTYSSQSFRSEHCLRSRFAHSYITVISCIHLWLHTPLLLPGPAFRPTRISPHQHRHPRLRRRSVSSSWAVLSMKTRISVDARTRLWHLSTKCAVWVDTTVSLMFLPSKRVTLMDSP